MWIQVSMNRALRAFLRGETVKVVDFNAETVLSLSEVFQRFSDGVAFFTETVATENLDFSEAVEDMTEDLAPIAQNFEQADSESYPPKVVGITEPLVSPPATEMVTAPPSISVTAEAPAPKKHKGRNKTVAEVETEYQKRGISDIPKLKALRAACWSMTKIADEFGCCPQTVANTLKRLEEQEAEV